MQGWASLYCRLQIKELSPNDQVALATIARLTPIVEQEREKMKEEMLGGTLVEAAFQTICLWELGLAAAFNNMMCTVSWGSHTSTAVGPMYSLSRALTIRG